MILGFGANLRTRQFNSQERFQSLAESSVKIKTGRERDAMSFLRKWSPTSKAERERERKREKRVSSPLN